MRLDHLASVATTGATHDATPSHANPSRAPLLPHCSGLSASIARNPLKSLHPECQLGKAFFQRQETEIERACLVFRGSPKQGLDERIDCNVGGTDCFASEPRGVGKLSLKPLKLCMDLRYGSEKVALFLRNPAEIQGLDDPDEGTMRV